MVKLPDLECLPKNEQSCLMCLNVYLGVTVHSTTGELLGTVPNQTKEAFVHLIRAVRVPGRTGVFAEASKARERPRC